MVTNGTLIDEKKVKFINDNNMYITVSWDGENTDKTRIYDVFKKNKNNLLQLNHLSVGYVSVALDDGEIVLMPCTVLVHFETGNVVLPRGRLIRGSARKVSPRCEVLLFEQRIPCVGDEYLRLHHHVPYAVTPAPYLNRFHGLACLYPYKSVSGTCRLC